MAEIAGIIWRDMDHAPTDGAWLRLKCESGGHVYVSGHLWRWVDGAWWNANHSLAAYGAKAVAWGHDPRPETGKAEAA